MRPTTDGKLCFSCIPARYVFIFLTSCGLFLCYAYKGFLSVAIVAMVRHGDQPESFGKECLGDSEQSSANHSRGDFNWDDHQQANLLGSYFYGYVILQLPAGVLADKMGAKWIFGGSIFTAAILSLLGPTVAHWGFTPFMTLRILQGLAQGAIIPCMNSMIAQWMPKMERSRAISIAFVGSALGSVVTNMLTGYLCDQTFLGGWPSVFYLLGVLGCFWFVLWTIFVYSSPDTHPFISQSEYDYIVKGQGTEKTSMSKRVIPWKSIWSSYRVYVMIVTHFGQNWGFLTILTLLPTYFTKILHMDIKTNGLISSAPYLCNAFVAVISSYITDKIRERNLINVSNLRKINNSLAFFGPAVCLIGVILSKCDSLWSIIFFVLALGFNGCCYPGFNSNYVDMAPDYAGILMGIGNSLGNIPGFVAPIAAANFYSKGQTLENWSFVFYTCVAVYIFTQTIHILFSTSELQSWGISKSYDNQLDNHLENDETNVEKYEKNN